MAFIHHKAGGIKLPKPKTFTKEEVQKIESLYELTNGNVSHVAQALCVTWDTARRWLHMLEIRSDNTGRMDPDQRVNWYFYRVQLVPEESAANPQPIEQVVEAPLGGVAVVALIEKMGLPYGDYRAHVRRAPAECSVELWRHEVEHLLGEIPTKSKAWQIARSHPYDRTFE